MFDNAKVYQIINKVSGYGLLAGSWGTNPSDRQVWQYPLSETGKNPDGFGWLLVPADDSYYWIINKISGHGLLAGSWGTNPSDRQVWQYPLSETGKNPNGFKWEIKQVDGGFQIINAVSQFGLLAGSWGTIPSDRQVWQYPLSETGKNPNGFVWDIKEYKNLDYAKDIEIRKGASPEDIGDIDRLTGFDKEPKEHTNPVLIGEVLIPFFVVKDRNYSPKYQVEHNPYYKFRREGYWVRVFCKEYHGKSERIFKKKTKVGLIKSQLKTTEDRMGVKVTASAKVSYTGVAVGAEASITAAFEKDLKVTTSESSTTTEETETEMIVTFPKGERLIIAKWIRADRYTLTDLAGVRDIAQSEFINEDEMKEDAFPK